MTERSAVERLDRGARGSGIELRQRMNELLDRPASQRFEAVREDRFRCLALAGLLIAESERFEEVSPAKADELAEAARMIADQPHAGELLPQADAILLRAWTLRANACRLMRDLHGAEVCFEKAMSVLAGPAGAAERAFYCQRLACLREEQGHREEAAALLGRAVELLREERDARAESACLCRLGFLALGEDDAERASRFFVQARALLSPECPPACSPTLASRCGLGLALCLATQGQTGEARRLWEHSRMSGIGDIVPDPRALLELDWLEGRLAVLLGDHPEAVGRLNSVRRRLFIQRRLLDAALCSLDLARVFIAMERESRIQELIDDLNRTWPVSFDQVRVVLALKDFRQAAREGRDLERAGLDALDLMRRPMAILKKL